MNTFRKAMLTFLAAALLAVQASAAEPFRVYYLGNSLTDELKYDSFVELAKAGGQEIAWGRHMIPGAPIRWLWNHQNEGFTGKSGYPKAAFQQPLDAITLQPFAGYEEEVEHAEKFIDLLKTTNPEAQVFIYAQWPGRSSLDWEHNFAGPKTASAGKTEYAYDKTAATLGTKGLARYAVRSRKHEYETTVLALNERGVAKKPVRLIPVGHVMQLLDQRMRAGQIPWYRSAYDFYSDGIHVTNEMSYIVASTFYATMFGKDPASLPVTPGYQGKPGGVDNRNITDELKAQFHKAIWEVVTSHPLAGVTTDKAVEIASPLLRTAVKGEPYYSEILPGYGKYPYRWRIASGSLPPGVTLQDWGALAGTPTEAGTFTVGVEVTDSRGATATKTFPLTVEDDTAPTIADQAFPELQQGVFARIVLKSSGGNGAPTWLPASSKKEADPLPGMSLTQEGELIGSPAWVGTRTIVVKVQDADGGKPESAQRTITLTARAAPADVLVLRPSTGTPAADGRIGEGEWDLKIPVEKRVAGDATVQAAMDLRITPETLFVAVRVQDATPTKGEKGDAVLLFIDGLNNREDTYNADDRAYYVGREKGIVRDRSIGGTLGLSAKVVEVEGGYVIEAALGRGLFEGRKFPAVVGFDIAVLDYDAQGNLRSHVVWKGTEKNLTEPNRFGTVILQPSE